MEQLLGLCSGTIEDYFDGINKPYRYDRKVSLLSAKP